MTQFAMDDETNNKIVQMLGRIEMSYNGHAMARYAVGARIGDELAKHYTDTQLATALVRNDWTWDQVLRANS